MDGEKQKVSIEQHMAYADAVAYLEALLKGFREGRIVVERGGESVVLTPPQSVNVEIEARRKGDKQKFSLELEWSAAPAVVEDPLTISADLPKADAAKPCDKGCPTSAPAEAKPAEAKPAPAPAKPAPSAPESTVHYGKPETAKPAPKDTPKDTPKDAPKPGVK
ncbi:amphi-Trp domain-containing protein [Nitratidesulfovibrio liaohensis]|uniref:amphi-Trp domain-containing protein n=1 Tax=Nitratidesulfovibrio liaohensis TaxID=2604158 RepID=UPI0014238A7F|nr:amphi-Trp domain-containing protein [Nitratidesulfovibrio liaohensis]